MRTPLQILIVEDNPDDADLLLAELDRPGFRPADFGSPVRSRAGIGSMTAANLPAAQS